VLAILGYPSSAMKILVTGATGFLGRKLVLELLSAEHEVSVLSRDVGRARLMFGGRVHLVVWAPPVRWPTAEELSGYDAVVHLAGERALLRRLTFRLRERIRDSRVEATRRLVALLGETQQPPRVMVSASSVAYYGLSSSGHESCENSPAGRGFFAELCHEWEGAAFSAARFGARVVALRFGLVLDQSGGVLAAMLPAFRVGLGGGFGTGQNYLPYVSLPDALRVVITCLENEVISGPVNVVAPLAVTQHDFARTLARSLGQRVMLPLPGFVGRALFGEGAEALFTGQPVVPKLLLDQGFAFRHPRLSTVVEAALGRPETVTIQANLGVGPSS